MVELWRLTWHISFIVFGCTPLGGEGSSLSSESRVCGGTGIPLFVGVLDMYRTSTLYCTVLPGYV